MREIPSGIELDGKCPYCDYRFAVVLRDVRGKDFAVRCIDCKEPFIVAVQCNITHTIHTVAGVDPDAVMDRLGKVPTTKTGPEKPKPPTFTLPKPKSRKPKSAPRVRSVQGSQY